MAVVTVHLVVAGREYTPIERLLEVRPVKRRIVPNDHTVLDTFVKLS